MESLTPTWGGLGNLTFDGTFNYLYDPENRLYEITQSGNIKAAYAYDARGRRKVKTVATPPTPTTTVYVTDVDNREVLEYDGTSGQIQRWYAYGLGIDEPLNQMNVQLATRATFIPDVQGSILATLDSSSGALTKAGYLPYGENPSATGGTFRFTGRRLDPETAGSTAEPSGLYYYRSRMYSPALGRFMQPDPIGYASGTNLYAYVNNDPLNNVDPFGLWTLQLGLSINIQLGPITLLGSTGFAIDNHGNIARLDLGGVGGGAGGRFSGGISVGVSNAENVGQLSSWFNNAGVGAAAGPSASVDAFHGVDESTGKTIVGGGFTAGVGLGGGGSVTKTYTIVTPLNYSPPGPAASLAPSQGAVTPASLAPPTTAAAPLPLSAQPSSMK